jgi:hypothetical protein
MAKLLWVSEYFAILSFFLFSVFIGVVLSLTGELLNVYGIVY